jgi:hypothetical protein
MQVETGNLMKDEMIRKERGGVPYIMPTQLARMYDELDREENLFCSVPPRSSFLAMREKQIECEAEMQRLTKAGLLTRLEPRGVGSLY